MMNAMADSGIEVGDYTVALPEKSPEWARLRLEGLEVTAQAARTPQFGRASGLGFTLHPGPTPTDKNRKLPG